MDDPQENRDGGPRERLARALLVKELMKATRVQFLGAVLEEVDDVVEVRGRVRSYRARVFSARSSWSEYVRTVTSGNWSSSG